MDTYTELLESELRRLRAQLLARDAKIDEIGKALRQLRTEVSFALNGLQYREEYAGNGGVTSAGAVLATA